MRWQQLRRAFRTTSNAESKCPSHLVFNIRVVQAPINYQASTGSSPDKMIIVGLLSLVELANSEHNTCTKTHSGCLQESGSINGTLTTLCSCINILRENQQNGTAKIYRDSKFTHLFKVIVNIDFNLT